MNIFMNDLKNREIKNFLEIIYQKFQIYKKNNFRIIKYWHNKRCFFGYENKNSISKAKKFQVFQLFFV
jgi:hypothetical protein